MNRYSSDINRQLVCSEFQRQNTKMSLAWFFLSLYSEKNIKISFCSLSSKSFKLTQLSSTVNAQTEASTNLSVQRALHHFLSLSAAGHLCVFSFTAIFNLMKFETWRVRIMVVIGAQKSFGLVSVSRGPHHARGSSTKKTSEFSSC